MNRLANIARVLVFLSVLIPVALNAQTVAQIVYVSAEGAVVEQADSTIPALAGEVLSDGSEIVSNDATVILSICDGSLVTVYPQSRVRIETLQSGEVNLRLVRGELLGDNDGNCAITVGTKAGEANVVDGVFGIVLNDDENNWVLQVRNLDGTVSFMGQPNLDTSATIVTILEPNKVVEIPAGEEFIVRGIYNAETDVFALAQEGVALAVLNDFSISSMADEAEFMHSIMDGHEPPERQPAPEYIEIPYEAIEVPSNKGSDPGN